MRYFFNYRDAAHYYPDVEGTDYASLAAAEADARLSVGDLLGTERAESDPIFLPGVYEISDAAGLILSVVRFDGKAAAA